MMQRLILLTVTATLLLATSVAQAAITCTLASSGFTAGYGTGSPTQIITQSSFSVTCTRGLVTDATSITYTVAADNGLNFGTGSRRVRLGATANRIKYELYSNSSCSTRWATTTSRIPQPAGTITMAGLTPTTVTHNFWGCIPAAQAAAAGTYTDTITMTPTYTGASGGASTFTVTVISPPTCAITSAPSTINLAYTAFSATALIATTSFDLTCSNSWPYTMAVSPASGALTGVNYTLSLPASSTGTGAAQTHTITATAPANQAGTCTTGTCTQTQATTLTITY